MATPDLMDGFADLWAPGADDVLIADPSGRWVVLLDHEARLSLRRPGTLIRSDGRTARR